MKSKLTMIALSSILAIAVSGAVFADTPPAPQGGGNPTVKADREAMKADREKMKAAHEQMKADREKMRADRKAAREQRRAAKAAAPTAAQ